MSLVQGVSYLNSDGMRKMGGDQWFRGTGERTGVGEIVVVFSGARTRLCLIELVVLDFFELNHPVSRVAIFVKINNQSQLDVSKLLRLRRRKDLSVEP